MSPPPEFSKLSANTEARYELLVPLFVLTFGVSEKGTTCCNHFEQTTTGMIILLVTFKMLSQVVDPFCQNGNLHLWGTGIQ